MVAIVYVGFDLAAGEVILYSISVRKIYSTLYSVFDLTARKVVGMTGADFPHARPFGIQSRCGTGCRYNWRLFFTCRVYLAFIISVVEVVGMTGGHF